MADLELIALDKTGNELEAPQGSDRYLAKKEVHLEQPLTTDSTIDGVDVADAGAKALSAVQPGDNLSTLINDIIASQAEAEAGADNTKMMTPLRVAQAISVLAQGLKNNFTATSDPVATNDNTEGYSIGSTWVNQSSDNAFKCVDASTNTAVWVETTVTASDLATVALSGDSDDLIEGVTQLLLTVAERDKLAFITITQAVDLDAMEATLATALQPADLPISGYGSLLVTAGATAEVLVDATPRKVTAWDENGLSSNMSVDHTIDRITASEAGTFEVNVSMSYSGTASKNYILELYKNGVATGIRTERKLGTGGDVGSCSFCGIVALAQNDYIEVFQHSTDGGSAMTLTEAQIMAHRLGA